MEKEKSPSQKSGGLKLDYKRTILVGFALRYILRHHVLLGSIRLHNASYTQQAFWTQRMAIRTYHGS